MLTAFKPNGEIDEAGMAHLVDWYIAAGVAGLFSICTSSEMVALTLEEQLGLAGSVVRLAAGRVPVVAGYYGAGDAVRQAEHIKRVWDLGVDGVVCLPSQLAQPGESEDALERNIEILFAGTGSIPLGIYESPVPYHRTISPALLGRLRATGRFRFMKDTSCDLQQIVAKLQSGPAGSGFRLFNAQTRSLLGSLRLGADGYSGTGANFCPDLFVWLCREFASAPAMADELQAFLTEHTGQFDEQYPVSAKEFLHGGEVEIGTTCRTKKLELTPERRARLMAFRSGLQVWRERLCLAA
jgi:4-hydroxy-tetrahydrodipicolinate synthase